ncbi:MAG: flagellar biosynthesis protein [Pseudomonadota bacterium]
MMSRPFVLEDFDRNAAPAFAAPAGTPVSAPGAGPDLEEERLASYEKGYSAGWDDATNALSEEQSRISTDLARHLQELSFTYHEAHAALQQEIADVVRGLVTKVLAPAAHPSLGELLLARVNDLASQAQAPVEILIAPENVARVEALVSAAHGPPLRLVAEPSLGAGQAFLRFGTSEEKFDLDTVLTEMTQAVDHYFESAGPAETRDAEARHG